MATDTVERPKAEKASKAPGASATGTATGTKVKTKVEATVNTQLLELFKKHDAAAEKAASHLIDICEFVAKENISNASLIKTIMEARGSSEKSAASQASRVRSLLKNQDQLDKLRKGEVTVRAAIAGSQKARIPTAYDKNKKFEDSLKVLTSAAKATGQDKASLMRAVDASFSAADIK